MKTGAKENKDFSILFKEIEKYKDENPFYIRDIQNVEELQNDEQIREFSEICQQITSSANKENIVYLTFS